MKQKLQNQLIEKQRQLEEQKRLIEISKEMAIQEGERNRQI